MHYKLKLHGCFILLLIFCIPAMAQKFQVRYASGSQKNFSGNVFLYLSKENRDPKDGSVGADYFPCYRIAVKNVKPNQPVVFDDAAISFPMPLSGIERGEYYVQAVWDNNLGGRAIGDSPGNFYNKTAKVKFINGSKEIFNLTCNEKIDDPTFTETEYCKELRLPSKMLSAFYERPATINAAVWLPKEYNEQPQRKFPVLYYVFGYGGDYHGLSGNTNPAMPIDTTPCIRIILDGNCPLGHNVYANSDNNGPWGDALTKELIPEIEKQYRTNAARLLTGHSSGGWTVLWLQTHYPTVFAACWSSSPDPVDFRNFQRINLYEDKNMFYTKDSALRLVATVAGRIPWATTKQFYRMENVISRGEQMHSFDAVFSQKNKDGEPVRLCDAYTGEINPPTVEHWKKYDISLYLRNNWNQLQPDLKGKIRVSVGEQDNFLLNYAVHLLDDEMKKLDAGFEFGYYPGDHFTVFTPEYRESGYKFLEQKYNDYINHSPGN
ncbi:MAG: alpha/beta hydrolase-fold protein [Ginsengibacter sp.]